MVFSVTAVVSIQPSVAQDVQVADLSDDEKQALDLITERSVTGAITFLASDEMGGRGTPSPEFRIATAYVAARFRAAGLTGGGKDGSFYQVAEIEATMIPESGIVFEGDSSVKNFGLLNAGEEVSFSGELSMADVSQDSEFEGPVVLPFLGKYNGRRGASSLAADVSKVRRRGATAVIIPVAEDSQLVALAMRSQGQPQTGRRSRYSLPILLVEQKELSGMKFKLALPAVQKKKIKIRNVMGVLKGSDAELAKEAIIVSAHLDHLGTRGGSSAGDRIFNGADDNASGVTGVLTLADAFGALKTKPKRTMIFMTFWGEERGLLGSKHFAANPLWPLENIVANINIEMIGRPESGARNKAWGTGWALSNLGDQLAVGAKRVDTLIFAHPQFSGDMLYRASDNWPLAEKGVIAHSFSAGSLHSDYHQPSDEWEKLELDHMTAVIRGLFAGTLPIANGQMTPEKAKKK